MPASGARHLCRRGRRTRTALDLLRRQTAACLALHLTNPAPTPLDAAKRTLEPTTAATGVLDAPLASADRFRATASACRAMTGLVPLCHRPYRHCCPRHRRRRYRRRHRLRHRRRTHPRARPTLILAGVATMRIADGLSSAAAYHRLAVTTAASIRLAHHSRATGVEAGTMRSVARKAKARKTQAARA